MSKKFDFNQGLLELEEIVNKMESGNLDLEESLKYFEQGVKLTKQCQLSLNKAQQRIAILTAEDGYSKEEQIDEF